VIRDLSRTCPFAGRPHPRGAQHARKSRRQARLLLAFYMAQDLLRHPVDMSQPTMRENWS
jgi:hypothetical protein